MSDQLSEFRIATAANMLGHSVLVPGSTAYPDSDGSISGAIDIPAASANTNIVYRSEAGEILHTQELGAQSAGLVGFSWQDIPQEVLSQNASIKVEAYADTGKGLKSVGASVYSEVLAASTVPPPLMLFTMCAAMAMSKPAMSSGLKLIPTFGSLANI